MSEFEKLMNELKNMKSEHRAKHIENSRETWAAISKNDFAALGFDSLEQLKEWILSNPYSNII